MLLFRCNVYKISQLLISWLFRCFLAYNHTCLLMMLDGNFRKKRILCISYSKFG